PVLREGGLEILDDGPLHTGVRVAPVAFRTAITRPLLADPEAAREPQAAVDNEDAAMGAVVEAPDLPGFPERQGTEPGEVAARGPEHLRVAVGEPQRSRVIQQHADAHARAAALRDGEGKLL